MKITNYAIITIEGNYDVKNLCVLILQQLLSVIA